MAKHYLGAKLDLKKVGGNKMRRRKDSNFDRQLREISNAKVSPARLPIVHVTATWPAKEILRQGKLLTSHCSVFSKELLYFFSLRPAYRSKFGGEISHQISRFPVAFILGAEAVPNPHHVYPFDTGGAARGAFDTQADPLIPLEDYALHPTHEAACEFMAWAFGDPQSYFRAETRPDIDEDVEPFQSVAVSYLDIARLSRKGSNEHDTRASSIEIATSHDVNLKSNVKLIIAPKQYVEGNEPVLKIIEPLSRHGCAVKYYDWQPNTSPDEYQDDLLRLSEEWYIENHVFQNRGSR